MTTALPSVYSKVSIWHAAANLSPEYAPGWPYDMQTMLVPIVLLRYVRHLT